MLRCIVCGKNTNVYACIFCFRFETASSVKIRPEKICVLQKCLSAKIRPRNFNTNIPTYKPFRYTANSDKWINEKTVFICSNYNGTSTLTRQHNSLIARKPDIYCLINIALMTKTEWTFQQRPCGLQTQQDFFCHKNLTLTMKYL